MNTDQRMQRQRDRERQPLKCRGCDYGTWTGTKQYCPRQECHREEKPRNFMQWHRVMAAKDKAFTQLSIEQRWTMYQLWRDKRGGAVE